MSDPRPTLDAVSHPGLVDVPTEFVVALHALRDEHLRPEVRLREVPAPSRVAPYAVALTGEVILPRPAASRARTQPTPDDDAELASGRFVLLHDPAGNDSWEGTFRVVTLVRAALEPELGADPFLAEVAWSWLQDALEEAGVVASARAGTVTRVLSQRFGALTPQEDEVEVEIRASWTAPDGHVGADLQAWSTVLCTAAGIPPLPNGVTALTSRR